MRSGDGIDVLWAPMSEPTPEFHIAVIYDTEEQALRAQRICRRLVQQFTGEFLFHVALCDYAGFEAGGALSPAIRQAGRATLVVVAANTPPPSRFWNWLQGWATRVLPGTAGIAALTDRTTNGTETVSALQQVCRQHHIDFISPPTETVTHSRLESNGTGGANHETISIPGPGPAGDMDDRQPDPDHNYTFSGDKGGPTPG
jgi:hypothetical protein